MADWVVVIAEIVGGLFMIAGVFITTNANIKKSNKEQLTNVQTLFQQQNADQEQRFTKHFSDISAELSRYEAVNDQRIITLTKQVEKHNDVIKRTYELEKDVAVMKVKMGISGDNSKN